MHVLVFLMLLLGVVAARLVWVQGVSAGDYAEQAKAQRLHDIKIASQRGTVYDREGEPLASSVEARTIYANPKQIKDKPGTARILAQVLGGAPEDYATDLSRDTGFVYIGRKVDLQKARALERMQLAGLGFLEDSRRLYPSGSLACQVLGFVGIDDHGLSGLEARYDSVLAGKSGVLLAERDPFGHEIPGGVVKSVDPVDGRDIVLTIDKDIQAYAQAELARAVKYRQARGGTVVVMSPKTGEIYAMASTPYFDPNDFGNVKDPDAYKNRAVTDAYEPGSTVKALLAAAAIDEKRFTPTSKLSLPPTLRIAAEEIRESHPRPAVTWSLTDIVMNSSNVGAAKVGLALGPRRLSRRMFRFGLGRSSGVDFGPEATGWLPPASSLTPLTVSTVSFGQGISASPLQLTRAFGALGNKGVMATPHFLLSQPEGATKVWRSERVVTTQTAAAATKMLQAVVTRGTGTKAKVDGYNVAGKTGTAQVALPNGGGYAKGLYESSFIGYLPAEDPEVVICVILSAPKRGIYGGAVAAPTFAAIGRFCMEHLKVSPSRLPSARPKAATGKKPGAKKPAKPVPAKPNGHPRSGVATGGNSGVTEVDEDGGTH